MPMNHPHGETPVAVFGARPEEARAAVILLHGRGATAESILELARHLVGQEGASLEAVSWWAPQAVNNTWYPQSFLAPREDNQPFLQSALSRVGEVSQEVVSRGVPQERTVLAGFSQGACLATEFAVRNVGSWGGVAAFTGGLIGAPGTLTSRDSESDVEGGFEGTPILLAAGDPDPHVPWQRMEESAKVCQRLGAEVDLRRYPGMGHTVNDEELAWLRRRLGTLVAS